MPRPPERPIDPPGVPWFLVILIVCAAIVVVPVALTIALVLPGGSVILALDCFADGACTVAAMPRGGSVIVAEHRGAMAYLIGSILVALGYATSFLTVTRTYDGWRALRARRTTVERLDLATSHAAAAAYLLLHSVLVAGVVAYLEMRRH